MVILAAISSLMIVLFQYFYRQKNKGKLQIVLSFFRFLTLFGLFLLLINPKLTKQEVILEKANLMLLIDDSSSIGEHSEEGQIDSIINAITGSSALNKKFNIAQYSFGERLNNTDSVTFTEPKTDIAKALNSLNRIYVKSQGPIIMLSDGNSTIGEDYEFSSTNQELPIYPIVIGDTTSFEDIRIEQVNVNSYAFLKNKFPIEVFVTYEGEASIQTELSISIDGSKAYTTSVRLGPDNNTQTVNALLNATEVGIKNIQIKIEPLTRERNTFNNQRQIAVEVIDEKTEIAIVSSFSHPDIGAIKKAIESNEQRTVSIFKPDTDPEVFESTDLFILYQPNQRFDPIFKYLQKRKLHTFTITGPSTDWDFLNLAQKAYTKNSFDQTEEVTPVLDHGFSLFNINDLNVDQYPPLETNLGEVLVGRSHDILFGQRIKGAEMNEPLLVLTDADLQRDAVLFGEHIWKWRMQSYREHQSFNVFDDLMGKIILYLTTDASKNRLVLDYKSQYLGHENAKILATYVDESYTFDPNASINLTFTKEGVDDKIQLPMLLKGRYFEADLGNLSAGSYTFMVQVDNTNILKSGKLTSIDFEVEKQFLSSNYKKLDRLAQSTGGTLFYNQNVDNLIDDLLRDNKFKPIQKSNENVVSLIDFRLLLGIILVALSTEWFIRKYNGLT